MRNAKIIILFVLGYSILCGQPKPVKPSLQNDATAEKYLSKLKAKYDKLNGYKISYKLEITSPDGKSELSQGTYIGSRDQYILETKDLKIVNDGKTQWNINHQDKEIQIQKLSSKKSKWETPMDIIKNYSSLFKYRVKDPEQNNKIILELVPLNKNNPVFKIDLTIHTKNLQILSSKTYDRRGYRMNYDITNTQENYKPSPTEFSPNKEQYKGYEELDMR